MKPTTLTIHQIFERERRYTVPLFQRAYVWDLEDQWEPLWEDIERQAINCAVALQRDEQPRSNHFLGAVVLNVLKVTGHGVARSEVIDGQQRLTTLQIVLAALRDVAAARGDKLANRVERLTVNPDTEPESDERFKVWPTNTDRHIFRDVMTAGSLEAVERRFGLDENGKRKAMPKMAEAYRFFFEAIRDFAEGAGDAISAVGGDTLGDTGDAGSRLSAIYQAMRIALQVVAIELEERDDPQVIFETLNARGQPLLPSDLIRNTLFLEAANKGKDIDRLYDLGWRHFDEDRVETPDARGENRFWHLVERQGRLTRPRIDLFIFHDLTLRTARALNIGRLFSEFRQWSKEANPDTEDYLRSLNRRSQHFVRLMVPRDHDRISRFARRLRSLDTSTVYPLAILLMELTPDVMSPDDFEGILDDLESYLVRRFVCQLTNKNYNNFFITVLQRAKAAAERGEDVGDAVRAELLRSEAPTMIWPDDEAFRRAWMNNRIYVRSRPDRSAMLLQAINDALRTNKSETVLLPEELTVEHLMPQSWEEHYPLPDEAEADGDETAEQRRERLLNTMGNLTLLTGPMNASISNGPFGAKAREIGRLSDLRLNASFREGPPDHWDEARIAERGEWLFSHAREVWRRPN